MTENTQYSDEQERTDALRSEIEFWSGTDSMDGYVEAKREELAELTDEAPDEAADVAVALEPYGVETLNDEDALAEEIDALERQLAFWGDDERMADHVAELERRHDALQAASDTPGVIGSIDAFAARVAEGGDGSSDDALAASVSLAGGDRDE